MDRLVYLNCLYDCYKELFTDKQRLYFESYYWENYSLSEIAENNDVSRNAVHNQLKLIEEHLIELEDKLKIYSKKEQVIDLLSNKIDTDLLERIKGIL